MSGAAGPRVPRITNDVIDGSLGVATSTTPVLTWKNVPAGVIQVRFIVEDLSAPKAVVLWSKTAPVTAGRASAAVDPDVVSQARSYRWMAESTGATKATLGPFFLNIDTQRLDVQPSYGFGGLSVAEATGEPVVNWTAPPLSAVSGAAGYTLAWRPSNTAQAGLPPGWNLDPSGSVSPWRSLAVNADSSVTVSSDAGASLTFEQVSPGDYQPVFGADQTWPQGQYATLVHDANGTWSVTDLNATVTEFSATSATFRMAWPETVWSAAAPHLVQRYDPSGRLVALTDPVSHDSITFSYAPAGCVTPAPGFVTAPAGVLCAVTAWDGTKTALSYVTAPGGGGLQLGRITAYAGTGMTAQSTDLGWDNLGRVVALRQPLADDAIAAGVVGGLTASDPRATTSVSYDTRVRVTSITAPSGLVPGPAQTPDQQARPRQSFGYDPFIVRADHVTTPAGWIRRDVISPSTMLETASFDAMNRETTTTWNVATSAAARELEVASGLAPATTYDKQGLPVSQTGPTSAPASPAAPHTSIDYDTDYSRSVTGTPLTGLSAFYFRGTSFNDTALARHQTGPLLDSAVPASTPASLAFQWAANPVGSGPWSARLTGNYAAPATGTFSFTTHNAQKLWVGAQFCAATCTLHLEHGTAVPVRIDVVAHSGAAGVNVTVTAPGQGAVPVPILAVTPAYDQPSSETIRDVLGPGEAIRQLKAREVIDPSTGKLTKIIQPTGAAETVTYAPYHPSPGSSSFGQPTSVTSPDGKTVLTSSYTGNQHATAPCPGAVPVPQRGLPSTLDDLRATVSSPPNRYAQTYNPSGLVTSSAGGGTTSCAGYDPAGNLLRATSSGAGLASWKNSGQGLILTADGSYAGRIISLDPGVDVLLEPGGRQTWTYTDLLGNAAWTAAGPTTSPVTTLYDPFGQPITPAHGTHAQVTDPAQAAFGQIGWAGGQTLDLRTPLLTMGARTYAPAACRFLQPDPQVSSTNAYEFAGSDPVTCRTSAAPCPTGSSPRSARWSPSSSPSPSERPPPGWEFPPRRLSARWPARPSRPASRWRPSPPRWDSTTSAGVRSGSTPALGPSAGCPAVPPAPSSGWPSRPSGRRPRRRPNMTCSTGSTRWKEWSRAGGRSPCGPANLRPPSSGPARCHWPAGCPPPA